MAEDIDWTRELKRVEHLRRAGRISEVIDIVRGLVAEDKGRVDLRLILAEALIQRNESLKAMKHIDDALQLDPKNLRALDLKALRLRAQGRDDEAAKVLDKLLELNPRNLAALEELALIFEKKKDWKKVEEMATKLAKLEGAEVHHRVRQAKARIYLGKLDQARKSLKEAIKRDAYHAKAHALLASVLTSQSHFLKAMEEAQVLLTIDPQYPRGSQLFELAAYLQVNFELFCAHGPGPYPQTAVQAILDKFTAQGLDRADYYPVLKERYGGLESVQGQLKAAQDLCPKPEPEPE